MISIQTGLKRTDKIKAIIGYSGKIISTDHLSKNINSRPEVILMHGDKDEVVPIESFLEAKEFFFKNNYSIEAKIKIYLIQKNLNKVIKKNKPEKYMEK